MAIYIDDITKQKLLDINVEDVADELGIKVSRHVGLCFMHDDHHPSLHFWPKTNSWYCFVCGVGGNNINLVQKKYNLNYIDSCIWLADRFNILIPENTGTASIESKIRIIEPKKKEVTIEKPIDTEVLEYLIDTLDLTQKGQQFLLFDRKYKENVTSVLKICSADNDDQILKILCAKFPTKRLVDSNLIKETKEGLKPYFNTPCIFFPYYSVDGILLTIQARYIGEYGTHQRFQFPIGSKTHVFNLPQLNNLKEGEIIYISEGVTDCLALLSTGYKAIAIPSATSLSTLEINKIIDHPIIMFPDNDTPGERLYIQLANKIQENGGFISRRSLPANYKDYSEFYVQSKQQIKEDEYRKQLAEKHQAALKKTITSAFISLLYRTSDSTTADIVKKYFDGYNLNEISNEYNRSIDTIKDIIKSAMDSLISFSVEDTPQFKALLEQNESLMERILFYRDLQSEEERNEEQNSDVEDLICQEDDNIEDSSINKDKLIKSCKATRRLKSVLKRIDCTTLGEVAALTPTQLLKMKGIGSNTVAQIERMLRKYGMRLSTFEPDGSLVQYNPRNFSSQGKPENHGSKWYSEDDELLQQLYDQGMRIKEICNALKRTRGGIRARLKRLGYDI